MHCKSGQYQLHYISWRKRWSPEDWKWCLRGVWYIMHILMALIFQSPALNSRLIYPLLIPYFLLFASSKPAPYSLPQLSEWQPHPSRCSFHPRQRPWRHPWVLHIQSIHKSCWLYLKNISRIWPLLTSSILCPSHTPALIWITAITSYLFALPACWLILLPYSSPEASDPFKMLSQTLGHSLTFPFCFPTLYFPITLITFWHNINTLCVYFVYSYLLFLEGQHGFIHFISSI